MATRTTMVVVALLAPGAAFAFLPQGRSLKGAGIAPFYHSCVFFFCSFSFLTKRF